MSPNNQKIPEGWSVKKLKACLSLLKDGTHGTHVDVSNGVMLLSAKDVVNGQIILSEDARKISFNDFNSLHKNYHIQNDDIVLTIVGTIGRCAIIKNYDNNYTFQRSVAILRPNKEITSKYLFSYIQGNSFQKELLKRQSVSAQPGVYLDDLSKISLIFPPLPEQEKIADILGTWDEAIEKLSNLIERKKLLKKGLMQKLLTGKTRLSGFTQPWKEVKLGDIGTISSAGVDKKIVEGEDLIKLLNYMDVYKKDFLYKTDTSMTVSAPMRQIKNCDLKKGDIFFTPSSETRDDIAHSAVVMENIPDGVYSYHIVRLRPTTPIDLKFSAYAFKTAKFYKQAYSWCEGSGQRYVISQDDFRNMQVYIPSDISEQQAIADVLSTADDEINLLNQKLEALKEQKKGLMQQLLTGQIRVKVN